MRFAIIVFSFLTVSLFAKEPQKELIPSTPTEISDLTSSKDHLIGGVINPLSGQICLTKTDLVVKGAQEIRLDRTYISPHAPVSFHSNSELDRFHRYLYLSNNYRGWVALPHLKLTYLPFDKRLRLVDQNGSILEFKKSDQGYVLAGPLYGISNLSLLNPGGQYDARNIRITYENCTFKVHFPDGTLRLYNSKRGCSYFLDKEILPNGKILKYHYQNNRPLFIESMDPKERYTYATLEISGSPKEGKQEFISSNQLKAAHFYDKRIAKGKGKDGRSSFDFTVPSPPYLISVDTPFSGKDIFSYSNNFTLTEYKSSLSPFECVYEAVEAQGNEAHYRVKKLKLPSLDGSSFIPVDELGYSPPIPGKKDGSTTVKHADGTVIVYHFTKNLLLNSVKTFAPDGSLKKTKVLVWNSDNRLNQLELFDSEDCLIYRKNYEYDFYGNPILEILTGNFSGEQDSFWVKREFSQDGRNLLLKEEEEGGKETVFSYLAGTNLLESKITQDKGRVFLREFWEYDDCFNLIKKIIDDGTVTKGRITLYTLRNEAPFLHMPEWVEEKYLANGEEHLLKKTHLSYDEHGYVSREDVFDSESKHVYTLYKEFDASGNLLSETNPLDQTAAYSYDENGKLLTETSFSGNLKKENCYDLRGRLISEKRVGVNGETKTTLYEYDLNDRPIQKTVNDNNVTCYTNDPIVLKPVATEYPSIEGSKVKAFSQYDLLGREISRTDPEGNTTHTSYNLYGSPLEILYPDGSREEFSYSKKGYLIRQVNQEGLVTVYDRDVFGRALSKTIGNELAKETFVYNTFHLLQEIDKEGHATFYSYDGVGRKIREERSGRTIEYFYDSLGRLSTIQKNNGKNTLLHHYKYDLLDRVIEEAKTDDQGRLLLKIETRYDEGGNKSAITRHIQGDTSTEKFTYDAFGRLTSFTDSFGYTTTHSYDYMWENPLGYNVLKTATVDPKGTATVIIHDPYDRPVCKEMFDHNQTTVLLKEFAYDANGNLIRSIDHLFEKGTCPQTQITSYSYTPLNKVHIETRGEDTDEKRITEYSYTPSGKVAVKTLPNGLKLQYTYSPLGFLESLISSDGSLHLNYRCNRLGDLIEAKDANTEFSFTREYDSFGNILKETSSNGFAIEKSYDDFNRPLSLRFPGGKIQYEYDSAFLRSVKRLSPGNELLYQHAYDTYDLSGRLIQESLIGSLGSINYEYDKMGQKKAISSSFFTQHLSYDELGNLIELSKDELLNSFDYDALSQLISENETSYTYDSQFNRLTKNDEIFEYNHLNELASLTYEYDGCGNLVYDGKMVYKYDLLNRLIEARDSRRKITYSYDPLDRRVSKTVSLCRGEEERILNEEYYFYDGENELGAYASDHKLKQLKVSGLAQFKESYNPVAIELEDKVFAPVLDCQGSIKKLVDIESKQITHEYDYSAFGENLNTTESIFNPWQYAGKRIDPETGLVDFGKRYYSPLIGRWLTTDPAGIHDSTNLYQYLFNNPFKYCDPDGQFVFLIAIPLGEIIFGTVAAEAILGSIAGAVAAYFVYENAHYVEDWMNQQFRDGIPYDWDYFGWDHNAPGDYGFEWKGSGPPSSGDGNWVKGEEKLFPDFNHRPPIGPHWDYVPEKKHDGYRLYPDGRCEPKGKKKKSKENS